MATKNIDGKYIFLEHAAEVKFQAYGPNLDTAFTNAGYALVQIYCEPATLQPTQHIDIHLTATTLQQLLYDYLSQIIVLIDAEHLVVGTISNLTITGKNDKYSLTAELVCQHARSVTFDTDVKSITYHQMDITQNDQGAQVTVVVDV